MLGHHWHANETLFGWRADDGPLIVVFRSSYQLKKNIVKVGPPLTKLFLIHTWYIHFESNNTQYVWFNVKLISLTCKSRKKEMARPFICLHIYFISYTRPPDKSAYWKTILFISQPKHMLSVLKRTVSIKRFFWAPKAHV